MAGNQQPRRGARAYVGGEVGHVGEGDGGALERALEHGVQRRLLPQSLLQLLHLRTRVPMSGVNDNECPAGRCRWREWGARRRGTHILLELQPARGRRRGGAGRRLRGEPPPRPGQRQRHGRPDGVPLSPSAVRSSGIGTARGVRAAAGSALSAWRERRERRQQEIFWFDRLVFKI
jgi:hypothetical protein